MLRRDYVGQGVVLGRADPGDRGRLRTWLIVRDAFLGIRRFSELRDSLGIAPNVLDERLTRLVDEGIFERMRYNEHLRRATNRLTDKGEDLFVALNALRQWGDMSARGRCGCCGGSPTGVPVIAALVPEGARCS